MLIDTHAHLNFNAYKKDSREVINRSLENNIWMINVGSQYKTSKRAVEIAEKYPEGVYAAVGLHPIHLSSGIVKAKIDKEEIEFETEEESFDYEKYKDLAKSKKVVAIGEIGLDYYYRPKTKTKLAIFKEKQKNAALEQLELARELNLPVIFHCRSAYQELINIIKNKKWNMEQKAVMHCFSGTWEEAREYLEMGFYIGFNGIIFKLDLKEVIKNTPPDRILLETDCPYLLPPSLFEEGLTRNEPLYIKYIAKEVAKLKNLSYEEISEITTQNAKKFFKI